MATTVTQNGSTIRVRADPRGIASIDIVDDELIVKYTNGQSESAGFVAAFPTTAIVSRQDGNLIKSRVSGEQLVGRS